MYDPISLMTMTIFELYNRGTNAVDLGAGNCVRIALFSRPNTIVQSDGYLVVSAMSAMLTNYPTECRQSGRNSAANYRTRRRLALAMPDTIVVTIHSGSRSPTTSHNH